MTTTTDPAGVGAVPAARMSVALADERDRQAPAGKDDDTWPCQAVTDLTPLNPKETNAFALVGLICGRFRDMGPDATVAAVARGDGSTARLTYGDLQALLSAAYEAGDRLQRIATWHSRETGPGGLVGTYCTECGETWPCDTRRMAEGTYRDDADD